MSEEIWKWYVGSCEEEFHTTCDTREEAVAAAKDYEGAFIVEATTGRVLLSGYFDAELFIESANDDAYDLVDPNTGDPIFDVQDDQLSDLQDMVRATIDAWQQKHALKFVPWVFSATRNLEWIEGDEV